MQKYQKCKPDRLFEAMLFFDATVFVFKCVIESFARTVARISGFFTWFINHLALFGFDTACKLWNGVFLS